jgi:hypothetical protein
VCICVGELYELHADRRGCFFTMERLRGVDLVSYVQDGGGPSMERLLECARQLASAIGVVHAAGLLHRAPRADSTRGVRIADARSQEKT